MSRLQSGERKFFDATCSRPPARATSSAAALLVTKNDTSRRLRPIAFDCVGCVRSRGDDEKREHSRTPKTRQGRWWRGCSGDGRRRGCSGRRRHIDRQQKKRKAIKSARASPHTQRGRRHSRQRRRRRRRSPLIAPLIASTPAAARHPPPPAVRITQSSQDERAGAGEQRARPNARATLVFKRKRAFAR